MDFEERRGMILILTFLKLFDTHKREGQRETLSQVYGELNPKQVMCLAHDLQICVTLIFCHLSFYVVTPITMFARNPCPLYFNLFYFLFYYYFFRGTTISTLIFTTFIKINLFIITNSDLCASDDIQQVNNSFTATFSYSYDFFLQIATRSSVAI